MTNWFPQHRRTIDALQLSSNERVVLKAVKRSGNEKNIAIFMYSEEWCNDPRNHSVPILDSFEDEKDSDTEFIVMPLLRLFDSPPFDTVEEAFDFVRQMLEVRWIFMYCYYFIFNESQGTMFMHEKSVAHR